MERAADVLKLTCDSKMPVDGWIYKLSCRGSSDMLFDVIEQINGVDVNFTGFFTFLTLVCITLYFVTSSDSGSHVVDCHASNGEQEPPALQKI